MTSDYSNNLSLFIGSGNLHKFEEIKSILGNRFDITNIDEVHKFSEPEETGETLEANALLKAKYYGELTKQITLADDTGLEVECLDNRPGVFTARYAGDNATYLQNNQKLLDELKNTSNREAKFVTYIALYDPKTKNYIIEIGVLRGKIADERRGNNGFGYDSIFIPENIPDKTLAELTEKEKNVISHRSLALQAISKKIDEWLKLIYTL